MQKRYAQGLFTLLFSALLASCGQNTPTPQAIPSPSPQPSATIIPTPVPTDTFFLEADQPAQDYMMAQLLGKLILVDGCPRVEDSTGDSVLLLWPYNYTIDRGAHPEQIRDSTGRVIARMGDYVEMAGGNVPDSTEKKFPNGCAGPLWIIGEPIEVLDPYFPEEIGGGRFSSISDLLEGTLVVVNGCLRVQTNENKSFLLIWPPGPYHRDASSLQVYDPQGRVVARVGEKIRVEGGEEPFLQTPPGDITKPIPMLVQPLPKECAVGPYWSVVYVKE